MCLASRALSLVLPLRLRFSDPLRSTRFSRPVRTTPGWSTELDCIVMEKIAWDLDDSTLPTSCVL